MLKELGGRQIALLKSRNTHYALRNSNCPQPKSEIRNPKSDIRHPTRATAPQADSGAATFHVATALSYLINPLILPPVGFGLVLWHFGAGAPEIRNAVGIGLVFFFLVPLAYVALMVRRGKAATLEIRSRSARTRPFLFGIASYAAGVLFLWMTLQTARPLMLAIAAIYPINTALVALINLRWKISVHVASIAGFLAGLIFVARMPWGAPTLCVLTMVSVVPWLLLIPLLMWARVRSGAHTLGEVAAGSVFGFCVTLIQLFVAVSTFGGV